VKTRTAADSAEARRLRVFRAIVACDFFVAVTATFRPTPGHGTRSTRAGPSIGSASASGCAPDRWGVACITDICWCPRRRDRV